MASDVKSPGTGANQIPDSALTTDDSAKRDEMSQYRDRFQIMQTFWSSIHDTGLKDDKFVAGEHWENQIKKERQEDRRPMLTYNLIPAFNRQITNRVRQERPTLKVTPVEKIRGKEVRIANIAGTKDYSLAEVYAGIFKNIEHVSRADQAYDTAMKHAVDHGFGYFYMIPQWSKIDPFVQELVIHRVKNSYSVMLDPDAQEADYRDMQDAFMFSNISHDVDPLLSIQKYSDGSNNHAARCLTFQPSYHARLHDHDKRPLAALPAEYRYHQNPVAFRHKSGKNGRVGG